MPLKKGSSIKVFKDNIAKSMREGKGRKQSVAIAHSVKSKSKRKGY
tara:strand:+ start:2593 stop:2730 length:138 start_codon:yes stop_codon:yes gene_type:complete